jgi:hypothetical protein
LQARIFTAQLLQAIRESRIPRGCDRTALRGTHTGIGNGRK